MPISTFSSFAENASRPICLASFGKNYVAASRTLHVLSVVRVQIEGMIFSSSEDTPTVLTNSPMFSIKLTTTSVLLFFSRMLTIGIRCYDASSLVREEARAHTACAILPLTCYDDSVAS